MTTKKDFFINAVRMVDFDDSVNIPTVVHYSSNNDVSIGSAALTAAAGRHELHVDFKVELGNIEPGTAFPRNSSSPVRLTSDFLHEVLRKTRDWLALNDIAPEQSTAILLAEPLAMQVGDSVSSDWLSSYRKNLERMLQGRGFLDIDFLPEPFAVFQYYRHGLRHPSLAEGGKKQVLVIDIGGGTCDICVIETTREGDISQSGKHAKPLAASSVPVAGFFINREIAIELLRRQAQHKNIRDRVSKGIAIYRKWRKHHQGLSALPHEYVNFVRNLDALVYDVEELKLTLSKTISDWRLDVPLTGGVPASLPADPFATAGPKTSVMLSAIEFRDIFTRNVWTPHLRPTIQLALSRAKADLHGAAISVVLLSGGTANIGWLRSLLQRDFPDGLPDADVLRLPDFQEVVAKGLAVECARRFHTEDGDFGSQTYNRLCLILDPDESGRPLKRFSPRTPGIIPADIAGVLLPSASVLRSIVGTPARWRVHLDRAPRRRLDYYFLRSSFDPDDLDNLQNVEERTVYTPPGASFDADLHVELTIAEDGTASPRFIYRLSNDESRTVATLGRPFYLDMTYAKTQAASRAYIGLDFGTSNTAVSFVDQRAVEIYKRRSSERFWNDLNELVATLPYPVAAPLSRYLGQVEPDRMIAFALDVVEGALSLAAYAAFIDLCVHRKVAAARFKGFSHRSAGPLWGLLKDALKTLGGAATVSAPFLELLTPELFKPIDDAVTALAEYKHGMADTEIDHLRPVQIICNIAQKAFSRHVFGFFQNVRKQPFSNDYRGVFRHASGTPPFLRYADYHGVQAFSDGEAFLLDKTEGTLLPLQPLLFWDHCSKHQDLELGHCYLFDKQTREGFTYKAIGASCTVAATLGNTYASLAETLVAWREADPSIDPLEAGEFRDIAEE